jgi:hypothetical protein
MKGSKGDSRKLGLPFEFLGTTADGEVAAPEVIFMTLSRPIAVEGLGSAFSACNGSWRRNKDESRENKRLSVVDHFHFCLRWSLNPREVNAQGGSNARQV